MRLIDADALVKQLNDIADMFHAGDKFENVFGVFDIEILINQQQTVDAVKHGHWKQVMMHYARCSVCGHLAKVNGTDSTGKALIHKALYKYCPHCCARMDGDKSE